MPRYIRAYRPGGTFFLTLVTANRVPILLSETARPILHEAIARASKNHPFSLDAMVLLPDHLHMVITLPRNDPNFAIRLSQIKSAFTRAYLASGGAEQRRSSSRQRQRARGVWLKRYWEHTIRDTDDLHRHFDYIHYNPIRHGYAKCPHQWPFSTFHRFVAAARYAEDWCCQCRHPMAEPPEFASIATAAGE